MTTEDMGADSAVDTSADTSGFDVESLSEDMAADLFPDRAASDSDAVSDEPTTEEPADEPLAAEKAEPETFATVRQPPQSWKKEMHEKFAALPPDVQEYIETREIQMREGLEKDRGDANLGRVMRDTMSPYRQFLQSQGIDEPRAVQSLLNAHYKLSTAEGDAKEGLFAQLRQMYGLPDVPGAATATSSDPAFSALQQRLNGLENQISASHRAAIEQSRARVAADVEAFASDPSHAYFDDVSAEIATLISAGHDLKTAYEQAVWLNPVTRAKELARLQTERDEAQRVKAKEEAEAAKKAAAVNVRSRDTQRTPTAPKGTMRDLDRVMEETMREIKAKAH